MVDCQKDPNLAPGTWNLWTTGKRRILFCCPKCNQTGLLNHEIADDGTVTPSVQCPETGCGFHEMIKLVGWEPERPPMEDETKIQ